MAYVEAISNGGSGTTAARSNAIRSGYFAQNRVVVSMNGAQRSGTIKPSIAIRERIGREPSTADYEFKGGSGYVPSRGHLVKIGHGTIDNLLFNGRIIRAERFVKRHVEKRPTYTIEANDLLFDLGRAFPANGFAAQSTSGSSLVRGLLASATPAATSLGFAATYVQGDLPFLAEFMAGPHVSILSAFDKLAEALGATWYCDVRQRIHFYTSTDPEPKPSISTITGSTAAAFALTYTGELPRVFSRVVGTGATTRTAYDIWSNEEHIPVESVEHMTDVTSTLDLDTYLGISTGRLLVQAAPRSVSYAVYPSALELAPALLTAAPTSATSDGTYWVADIVQNNALDLDVFRFHKWVGVEGYYFRVSSITGFSSSANSIYSRIFVPKIGPGAPPPTFIGAIPAGTAITAERAEFRVTSTDAASRILPKGTAVAVYYEVSSTTLNQQIQSLCVSAIHGTATDTLGDSGLRPDALIAACQAALGDAQPDQWETVTLETRDPLYQRGQTVSLGIAGPGESGGPSIAGSYRVTDVTIGGFDETADSKGPIRQVTLAQQPKPSLYYLLETWDV